MSLGPTLLERAQPLILVVDDDEDNLLLTMQIVMQFHCAIITATTGQAAFSMAQTYLPDLILLDILLPDITGMAVLGALRQTAATATIPVIAVTALATPEERQMILDAGANDYLVKPYDLEALEAVVRSYLGDQA